MSVGPDSCGVAGVEVLRLSLLLGVVGRVDDGVFRDRPIFMESTVQVNAAWELLHLRVLSHIISSSQAFFGLDHYLFTDLLLDRVAALHL